jgi:hypothetical protein
MSMEFAVKLRDYEWDLVQKVLAGETLDESDQMLARALSSYLGAAKRMEEACSRLRDQTQLGPKHKVVVMSGDPRHLDNELTKQHLRRED